MGTACCAPSPKMTAEQKKQEEDWRAEDDVRTLVRAAEIRKDKPRLKRAQAKAKEQLASIQATTDAITK